MEDLSSPPPPPGSPGMNPQRKGLPPLAWAGIGCGTLFLIGLVLTAVFAVTLGKKMVNHFNQHPAKEAADALIMEYPDLRRPAENAERGEVTLRSSSTGNTVATTYEEVVHGRVMMNNASGTSVAVFQGDLSKAPAWVPRYPGGTGEISVLHQDLPHRIHGVIVADTTDGLKAIERFFDVESGRLFTATASGHSSSDNNGARTLDISYSGGKKKLEVYAYGTKGSPMTVMSIYTEEK